MKVDVFLYADPIKGNPKYISLSEKDKASNEVNVPFKLFSNVDKPMGCTT